MATEERRSFLSKIAALVLGVAGAVVSWGLTRFALFEQSPKARKEFPNSLLQGLTSDTPLHVAQSGVWLVKPKKGGPVLALDDRCTHLGCRHTWDKKLGMFRCPCHGSEFSPDGSVKKGPATKPLVRLFLTPGESENVRLVDKPPTSQEG